jgi:hypothetical protein
MYCQPTLSASSVQPESNFEYLNPSAWQRRKDFSCGLGLTQPPVQWYWGPFLGAKARLGHDTDHSPPSSAEVENE